MLVKNILEKIRHTVRRENTKPMQLVEMEEFLLSSRLTLFSDGKDKWTMALEKLVMEPDIRLQEIFCGNCYNVPALFCHEGYMNCLVDHPVCDKSFQASVKPVQLPNSAPSSRLGSGLGFLFEYEDAPFVLGP